MSHAKDGQAGLHWLQITVGHQTLANQNLLVSDEIPPVFGDYVWRVSFNINHFMVKEEYEIYLNIKYIKFNISFGDVRPKLQFVQPRWCLYRTYFYVLSREKKYLQPCLHIANCER